MFDEACRCNVSSMKVFLDGVTFKSRDSVKQVILQSLWPSEEKLDVPKQEGILPPSLLSDEVPGSDQL